MLRSKILEFLRATVLFLAILVLFSCSSPQRSELAKDMRTGNNSWLMDPVQGRGKLVALTSYGSTSYFNYRGQPMGYQYDLLRSFADYLGVELEIIVNNSVEGAFTDLLDGDGDLIAQDLTVTSARKQRVDFSNPFGQTRQVLVQRKSDHRNIPGYQSATEQGLVRNPAHLAHKTIHIQANTFLVEQLHRLQRGIGDTIYILVEPEKTAEDLIKMVASGEISYTVCDEQIASINRHYYPDIDVATPVSFYQNVAWAVRKDSPVLLDAINSWLDETRPDSANQLVSRKYFTAPLRAPVKESVKQTAYRGMISVFDDIIKEQSALLNWDWRLLASLIYEESTFNPVVRSRKGAFGLMQMMPQTMETFGIDTTSSPQDHIAAGVRFLQWLDKQLRYRVLDDDERVKFVLAAYNVGIAHIYDAMRLAEKYGRDPAVWTDNVDYFILNKSDPFFYTDSVVQYGYARGEEPYQFVGDVFARYDYYRGIGR